MTHVDVFTSEFEYDGEDPPGYRAGISRVGQSAGGHELTVKLFELPAGESLCPYHYEYVEEWLIVLEGAVVVRVPEGEERVERGGLKCFPAGPAGAHKLSNPAGESARVLMFSSAREPAVAVYPDSDKIGVWPGNAEDNVMLRRDEGNRDYYEGEI